MNGFYWPLIGILTGGGVLVAFLFGLWRWPWSFTSLYVALASMLVALLHMVAPIRGTLDPDYPGYRFGLIQLEAGPQVGIVAGLFYLLALVSTVLALRNRPGPAMWTVAFLNAVVSVNLGLYLIGGLAGLLPPFRLQFGQYLQLGPWLAAPVAFAVVVLPFAIGLPWAVRKAIARND
jgi:hypothetical protein